MFSGEGSVRGAGGTGVSTGVGIPGTPAAAWVLVENLGNAPETVSLAWNGTPWGDATRAANAIPLLFFFLSSFVFTRTEVVK